jgi:hypothetical protein
MTKKKNDNFSISNHFIRRSYLIAVAAVFLLTSCFFSDHETLSEYPKDSVTIPYTLKDKRYAEIKYEKLVRQYTSHSWLALGPSDVHRYCYTVITATIKKKFGWDKVYRWIDFYPDYTVYFTKVDRLVFKDDNVFIQYTYIPAFPADDYWHFSKINSYTNYKNRNPFNGNPRLLVKYGRYKGTSSLREDKDNRFNKIDLQTYKWPKRYIWEDVSKKDFDKAAEVGDVISLNDITSNGKFEFYDFQVRFDEDIYYYGRRIERETTTVPKRIRKAVDYYDYYSKRIIKDSELDLFLSSVKTGDATKVEELLNKNPALINSYDADGMTALHLALFSKDRYQLLPLLYKFKPRINVIDYKCRTPLDIASLAYVDKTITNELVKMGRETPNKVEVNKTVKKGRKQNENAGEWGGNDVYQVWMRLGNRQIALFKGREQIIRELELNGAPASELSRRIELILDNTHVARSRLNENTRTISHFLVRICAPDLRELVNQYNKQK